jgi:hypothetical protein
MSHLRRQLTPLVPTVAALFALCILAPRAPLLFHHHDGGEHTHAHGDTDLLGALAAALTPEAPHRHDAPTDTRPGFTRPGADQAGHYHQQTHFQRGVLPTAAFVAVSTPLLTLASAVSVAAPTRAALAAKSRGPPRSLLS